MPITISGERSGRSQRSTRTSSGYASATQPSVGAPKETCRKIADPAPCTTGEVLKSISAKYCVGFGREPQRLAGPGKTRPVAAGQLHEAVVVARCWLFVPPVAADQTVVGVGDAGVGAYPVHHRADPEGAFGCCLVALAMVPGDSGGTKPGLPRPGGATPAAALSLPELNRAGARRGARCCHRDQLSCPAGGGELAGERRGAAARCGGNAGRRDRGRDQHENRRRDQLQTAHRLQASHTRPPPRLTSQPSVAATARPTWTSSVTSRRSRLPETRPDARHRAR